MERCERCVPAEPGSAFCGVCGSFLDWEQSPDAPPPVRPSTGPRPAPPPDDPVTARPVDPGTADAPDDTTPWFDFPTPTPTPTAAPTPVTEPTPAHPATVQPPAHPATWTPTGTAAESAPVTPTGEPVEVVEAVQPARPSIRRPVVRQRPPSTEESAGGVTCPVCGTGNPPDRRFCRRCGNALDARTGPSARESWWRRLRRAVGRAANWLFRPRSGVAGLVRRIAALLLVVALLAGLAYGVARFGPQAGDAVRDRLADPQPVSPVSVQASSQAGGHPAEAVVDGISNSYWAPASEGAGGGEYVELTFAAPFRLLDLIVHAGVSAQRDEFLRQARPAELELTLWTSGGTSESRVLQLADQAGPQTFHHVVDDVVRARLTVRQSYGSAPDRRTAVAEVEFFRRP
ncbi:NADase-type glycan-binding domain-containing protein [Micromonospora sp. NPDC049900]|uniref:NADase-type glycan-binding domain-containing protein n=1 Tax=Micromonospora sp. NPDC049900 TaxID=3364275 RepID=UPI0037A4842B